MSSFSPVKAGLAGYGVIVRNPVSALVWFVIVTAYAFGYAALGTYTLGEVFQALANITNTAREAGTPPDPTTLMQLSTQTVAYSLADIPLRLVVSMFVVAAIVRAALQRPAGFAHLKLGGDEMRLFVTLLVVTVLFVGVMLAGVILIAICAAIAAAIGGRGALPIGVIPGAIVTVAAVLFFTIKLCFAVPGTMAQKQIRIFESWRQTKGRFWKILLAHLIGIVALAPVAGAAIFAAASIAKASGAIEAAGNVRTFLSYPPFTPQELLSAPRLAFYLLTGLPGLLLMTTMYGVPTSIYQQLGGEAGMAELYGASGDDGDDDEDWDED